MERGKGERGREKWGGRGGREKGEWKVRGEVKRGGDKGGGMGKVRREGRGRRGGEGEGK